MLKLLAPTKAELMFKNSRFVAEATPVNSPDEARALWKYRKDTYDNGGHIVYAFITGSGGNIMGCSDDGEPSGTAGRPVLAVLKGSNITNAIITIARYFGGTKLGTGGLVHAYGESAKAALAEARTAPLIAQSSLSLVLPYNLYSQCRKLLEENSFEFTGENFTDCVHINGVIARSELEKTIKFLKELSGDKIMVDFKDL